MFKNFKYQIILHFIVFIWGFTAILGKFIHLNSNEIVWYRMGIAFVSLLVFGLFSSRNLFPKKRKDFLYLLLIGCIVGVHWLTFFEAIKVSSVSVAVIAMSTSTFFMAIMEPIFFKRKVRIYELLLSLAIVGGIFFINSAESNDFSKGNVSLGISLAVVSSFLATTFTVLNGKLVKKIDSFQITIWEMFGGFILVSSFVSYSNGFEGFHFNVFGNDLIALLVLAIVCTSFAFLVSTWVMKFVTPFTVAVSVNMEPIYAMILAILLYPDSEVMSFEFYIGTLIIIIAVFLNAFFKSKFSTT